MGVPYEYFRAKDDAAAVSLAEDFEADPPLSAAAA